MVVTPVLIPAFSPGRRRIVRRFLGKSYGGDCRRVVEQSEDGRRLFPLLGEKVRVRESVKTNRLEFPERDLQVASTCADVWCEECRMRVSVRTVKRRERRAEENQSAGRASRSKRRASGAAQSSAVRRKLGDAILLADAPEMFVRPDEYVPVGNRERGIHRLATD